MNPNILVALLGIGVVTVGYVAFHHTSDSSNKKTSNGGTSALDGIAKALGLGASGAKAGSSGSKSSGGDSNSSDGGVTNDPQTPEYSGTATLNEDGSGSYGGGGGTDTTTPGTLQEPYPDSPTADSVASGDEPGFPEEGDL